MRYEIGRKYWRIKEGGEIQEFFIMKGLREARGVASGNIYLLDTYFDANDSIVLTDEINLPPTIMPSFNMIFDSEKKAVEFLVGRLLKRKQILEQEEYFERMKDDPS